MFVFCCMCTFLCFMYEPQETLINVILQMSKYASITVEGHAMQSLHDTRPESQVHRLPGELRREEASKNNSGRF